ncbi:MAG: SDR family NAD(P)-dependent oxidoreductase, partial [Pseudomonadota bacterium]
MSAIYLITGGSRGIGAAVAKLAGAQGAKVCVNYVANGDAAAEVVEAVKATGGDAIAVQGDMAVEADVVALFDACEAQLGPATVLVNNAGVLDLEGRLEDFGADRIARIIDVNVT